MAGMLAGMLMGMVWSGYAALVFTFDPPKFLSNRIESGNAAKATIAVALGSIVVFLGAGIAAAMVADASMPGVGGGYALIPSGVYASLVGAVTLAAGLPMLAAMRDKLVHVAVWMAMGIGTYGILIPNLVLALQNRT